MKIDYKMTDEALLQLVGERLSGFRLARNLTQRQLAEQAGLGLRTVQRLEQGTAATQLSGFIRMCRVLGLVENLEAFIPQPAVSPMAQLKQAGRKRQRATGRKAATGGSKTWMWGEPA
ncbi:MAG: helix-turn-helix transcriptional regulator [Bdellovibrionaceae bacterium]|nr:helix-turn-helix transcriptional regulator [Pseudobdellovibrionaceae bacterium]